MPHKTLVLMMTAACNLLLCSMRDVPMHAFVPPCQCTNFGGGWVVNGSCSGTPCSAASMITDNLTCTNGGASNTPCTIGGSVTVTYPSCASVACVLEANSGTSCPSCPANPAQRIVTNGHSDTPQIAACCVSGGTCNYTYDVLFYASGSTCGTVGSAFCRYSHTYRCS